METENRPENNDEYAAQKCVFCCDIFCVICFYLDHHFLESDKRGKQKTDRYQKRRKASTTEQNCS